MPLVTKKNGIRSPKPTASSFDSKRSSSLPLSTVCTSRPAANAPRMTSSPRSAASTTRANTDSTVSRTGSCPLVFSERSRNSQLRPTAPVAIVAASTATTTNATSSSASVAVSDVAPSSSVTIRTGPNSPTAPTASTWLPLGVSSWWVSRSSGISVPSAVVAIAEPVSRPEITMPPASSRPASEYARASEHSHPIVARRSGVPRTRSKRIS